MKIQLKSKYDKQLKRGFWIAPEGNEYLPRTSFEAGTTIGPWKIDLHTGEAELITFTPEHLDKHGKLDRIDPCSET